ncbi:MAG: penicillin-binding protein 1A, partial [Alphaproteobacteria bacterium]
AKYSPPITTRVHAGDGRVLAEFSREHRLFVPIAQIPDVIKNAFLSAEDKGFYRHPGLDLQALIRAVVRNLEGLATGRRPVGGSTITQQVAKNFLLTNEVSYERKIKEAILSFRIERALTKDQILELYLNEIYLGESAYGVAAATMTYFGKPLAEVTPEEAAYLAALPKAPTNYHPVRRRDAATTRRNWVLGRMEEDGRLSPSEVQTARAKPLTVTGRPPEDRFQAPWFAEEIRRELLDRYGDSSLYGGGMSVRATIDPALQKIADDALHQGLEDYDRRHGYRGPITRLILDQAWQAKLATVKRPPGLGERRLAIVLRTSAKSAEIGLADGSKGTIPYNEVRWARPTLDDQKRGRTPRSLTKVLGPGDVIAVSPAKRTSKKKRPYPAGTYTLDQIPDVDGAIIAIDPHTGRVLAMTGGYSAERSQFNRATQAARQPGSAIKPFVYLAALEAGYTPATLVLDAPFVMNIPGKGKWKPANYSGKIYGPSPMRLGLEKSRNLMTIRLAQHIGIGEIMQTAKRFGVGKNMRPELGSSLGTGEVTLIDLTAAYAMLANGGWHVTPTFVDSVQDRTGRVIFRHDDRACPTCIGDAAAPSVPPELPDNRQRVTEPTFRYQLVSMMQGVIENGTARRVRMPGRPLAGKTGTTNDSYDAWFVGFSSNLAVGVFVGFDQPRTLGGKEAGGSVAAPIFKSFMRNAWKLKPGAPFKTPPGLEFVRVSRSTGLPPERGDKNVVLEGFIPGTRPQSLGPVIGAGLGGGERRQQADRLAPRIENGIRVAPVNKAAPAPVERRSRRRKKLGRVY